MAAVIQAQLSKAAAHEAMTTGKRYTAEEALRASIVQQIASEAEVLTTALALAKAYAGKHGPTLAAIKKTMYRDVLQTIDTPQHRQSVSRLDRRCGLAHAGCGGLRRRRDQCGRRRRIAGELSGAAAHRHAGRRRERHQCDRGLAGFADLGWRIAVT